MIPRICIGAAIAALALLPLESARAAESVDSCVNFIDSVPAIIATQGTWCLRADLATSISSGNAITLNNSNITIDCNGYKLGNLAAGIGTGTSGIRALDRSNIIVRNCNLRGFRTAIGIINGSGHVIEDVRSDGASFVALWVTGAENVIVRRNQVQDVGGAPAQATATGIAVQTSVGCGVHDNAVVGVAPSTEGDIDTYPTGILVDCEAAEVRGNRVSGLVMNAEGRVNGIRTQGRATRVVGNQADGNGQFGSGFSGEGENTVCQDNFVVGFFYPVEYCLDVDNIVMPVVP